MTQHNYIQVIEPEFKIEIGIKDDKAVSLHWGQLVDNDKTLSNEQILKKVEKYLQEGLLICSDKAKNEPFVLPSPKPIPIKEGERIAKKFGYEQIFILGRRTGENGVEHLTTYGINKKHCSIAAQIGDFLKYKIMNWKPER